MAKRRGRRRRFNLRRVRCTPEKALSTLASDTVIETNVVNPGADGLRVISAKGVWSINGLTAGEGPVTVGFAHSDYSVTEVKECLEAIASIDQGDKVAREQANRLVRIVGMFTDSNQSLNDGKPISTKLNWFFTPDDNLEMFAYNEDTGPLSTGATVRFTGDLWVKDNT